jgi:spermidine/putrescine transport system ATP-binding protein
VNTQAMPAVRLSGVSRFFGEVRALDNVDLDIDDGEFFSMLGPSGSGKTTCLRMIAGFDQPDVGSVLLHGHDVTELPPYEREVNTVFQDYALFPHMTVGDNIAYGLMIKKVPKPERQKRVQEMLELVRLPDMAGRRPSQLSGGQRQRVALARALINRPRVLLLDEPLGALDLKLRKEMQLELKQLQREVGITFVYVTHDQEEALTMSDRIAVMAHGHVLQVGAPLDIYERPNSRFVADFIGETNFISGTLLSVDGQQGEFQADDLKMIAAVESNLPSGVSVTLAVRPERISLSTAAPSDTPNVFAAEVYESIYVGTDTRYSVRLTPTISLKVRQQNTGPLEAAASAAVANTKLWVSWQPNSARLLAN